MLVAREEGAEWCVSRVTETEMSNGIPWSCESEVRQGADDGDSKASVRCCRGTAGDVGS